jgi:hypothetical protein
MTLPPRLRSCASRERSLRRSLKYVYSQGYHCETRQKVSKALWWSMGRHYLVEGDGELCGSLESLAGVQVEDHVRGKLRVPARRD